MPRENRMAPRLRRPSYENREGMGVEEPEADTRGQHRTTSPLSIATTQQASKSR